MGTLLDLINLVQDEIRVHLEEYPNDQVASWLEILAYAVADIERKLEEAPKPHPGLNFIGG